MVKLCRLWKSYTNQLEEILQYDKSSKSSSIVKVDAVRIDSEEASQNSQIKIDECNIADDDIVIVEI
jgi:hypothetical protein